MSKIYLDYESEIQDVKQKIVLVYMAILFGVLYFSQDFVKEYFVLWSMILIYLFSRVISYRINILDATPRKLQETFPNKVNSFLSPLNSFHTILDEKMKINNEDKHESLLLGCYHAIMEAKQDLEGHSTFSEMIPFEMRLSRFLGNVWVKMYRHFALAYHGCYKLEDAQMLTDGILPICEKVRIFESSDTCPYVQIFELCSLRISEKKFWEKIFFDVFLILSEKKIRPIYIGPFLCFLYGSYFNIHLFDSMNSKFYFC